MKTLKKNSLRKANFSDIEFLWYLRNQPYVYKYSRQNRPVSWKEHVKWILPIILGINNKRELFIIKNSTTPIGQIRFDYNNQNEAKVSISILKEFQGKGFATRTLKMVIQFLKKNNRVKIIIAEIHKDNLSSVGLFEKLGFKFLSKKGSWLKYNLKI